MKCGKLLFLCVIFLQISVSWCSTLLEKGDTAETVEQRIDEFERLSPALARISRSQCPDCVCRRKRSLEKRVQNAVPSNADLNCCECSNSGGGGGGGGGCFPASATVKLASGKSVQMSELQVGDEVQTVSPHDGSITYNKVRAFVEKQKTATSTYKSITTSRNETITMTGIHIIFARKSDADKFYPTYADDVSIGDEVLVQGQDELKPAKVMDLSSNTMQGVYFPVTMDGSIVVDRVLASCYALIDHDLSHLVLAPIRWFPQLTGWIFGEEDDRISGFVEVLADLGGLVLPFGQKMTDMIY